jgi:hypothetical protein
MIQFLQTTQQLSTRHRLMLAGLLLALLLINLPSAGFVRFGGGDDEGSGFGGTGRVPVPGSESGLGGTGFRPFLGYSEPASRSDEPASELTIYHRAADLDRAIGKSLDLDIPAARPVESKPLPSPAQFVRASEMTRDSSAILITEQIQFEMDELAIALNDEPFGSIPTDSTDSVALATMSESAASSVSAVSDEVVASVVAPQRAEPATLDDTVNETVSWQALSQFLAQERAPTGAANESELAALSLNSARESNSSETLRSLQSSLTEEHSDFAARAQRPDRVQRPELPTMQRVRPVQRAGLLPPRIQPLKL